MRIAITVDPYIPVPPAGYGGIERTVDFVCRGLTQRGQFHDCDADTLWCPASSRCGVAAEGAMAAWPWSFYKTQGVRRGD